MLRRDRAAHWDVWRRVRRGSALTLQHLPPTFRHGGDARGKGEKLLENSPLLVPRFAQNGMERRYDRHSQFAKKCQNVRSGGTKVNPEFVLQAHDIHVADVEEVCRAHIGSQVLFLNFKTDRFRVIVAAFDVIHRDAEALALRIGG
jgi:hypothetical protein